MFIDPLIYDDEARALMAALLGDCAAINDNDLAVHETVPVATHEGGILSEFGRTSEPSFRNPEVMHLEQTLGQGVPEIGIENSGRDSVDRDTEVCGLA